MKVVKIVPPEPDKRGYPKSQGTKVLIGDVDVPGVTSISIHYKVDEPVRAEIELCDVWQDTISALGEFYMGHPLTGKTIMVKRIEFEDGSVFEC